MDLTSLACYFHTLVLNIFLATSFFCVDIFEKCHALIFMRSGHPTKDDLFKDYVLYFRISREFFTLMLPRDTETRVTIRSI